MRNMTTERLQEVLHYFADTGVFTWLAPRGGCAAGSVAGRINSDGYQRITVDGTEYQAHRLAWLYVFGSWPKNNIDHINGAPSDNRIENLREATQAQNTQNQRRPHGSKKSGLPLGVSWSKIAGRFQASISFKNKANHLGYFDCPEKAHQAYLAKKRELHPFSMI